MYKILLIVGMFLLAACSQTAEFQRPPPPIPVVWPNGASGVEKGEAAKTHWSAFFTDPRLQALIEAALESNRDLRIAAARVEEARAQYGVVRADQVPSVNFGSDSNASLLSAVYEVDFWGRVAGLSEAARVSFLATEEARRAVHLSLVADVASTYFTLLQMDEMITLNQATVELREQSLALITKGRDLGAIYDYEYQQASGLLESARGGLAALEYQRVTTENKLNFLVGQVPPSLPPGRSLNEQELDSALSPGIPSDVLLLRPDVIASEQRLRAAHANIGVARAAFFPKIALTAGYGIASQGLTALLSGGGWFFAPIVSAIPIFDRGRTASGVDIAQARKVIAVAEYEKTIQLAFREVADLLSARGSLASQLQASMANSNAQNSRRRIAQARYQFGVVSYLDVLDSQREFFTAQQANIQLRRAQLESAAQLYKALGGGVQVFE
jgi:multidrug efflux system outer membrane protein